MKHSIFTSIALLSFSWMLVEGEAAAAVLTELPDGISPTLYFRSATSIRPYGTGATKQETEAGVKAELALSADGKTMYLNNGVGNNTQGYLVGTVNGDNVTFDFPQSIMIGESELTVCVLIRNPEEGAKSLYIPDPDNQSVTFSINDGNLSVLNDNTILGMLNSKMNWSGKALSTISYKKVDTTEVTPPAGAEIFNLALAYDSDMSSKETYPQYRLLSGCKDGGKLYVKGIDSALADKWIVLDIEGNKVNVKGGQYLGLSGESVVYFCTAVDTPEWNAAYQVWEHEYTLTDGFEMAYDEAKGELKVSDKNYALCVNAGDETYLYGSVYRNPILTQQPLDISLTPRAPFMDNDVHGFINGAEPELIFQMLPLNEKGQMLDTSNLGYIVYSDNKPYVFNGFDYWFDDEEDRTFIPWFFQSAYIYSTSGGMQFIYFQEPFVQNITVRAVYRTPDGQEYLSEALNPLNPTSGVNDFTDQSEITGIEYFDLNGIRTDADAAGVIIRCTKYSDGKIEYKKILK